MKGIVFTEFLDFLAQAHGDDMVDDVIEIDQKRHEDASGSFVRFTIRKVS